MIGGTGPLAKAYLQLLCSATDESNDSSETEETDNTSDCRKTEAEDVADSTDSSEVEDSESTSNGETEEEDAGMFVIIFLSLSLTASLY